MDFFVPRNKNMYSIEDGWMDWWMGIGMRVMDNGEETRAINGGAHRRLLMSSPPTSSCTDAENKQNRREQISGVYPSHCFKGHLQVQISAAEGGMISAKPQELKIPPVWTECVCVRGEHRQGLGHQFGVQFQGKEDGIVFKVCAKIPAWLLLEHEPRPLFVHFQFASLLSLNFAI